MTSIQAAQAEIIERFGFFDDWTERYQMLISMGKTLSFPVEKQIEQYLIRGCQSQVWMDCSFRDGCLHFSGVSDSAIVSGLMAVLFAVYSGQSAQDIAALSPDFLGEIGFEAHLSPTRRNGLYEMLKAIKRYAAEHLS